MTRAGDAGRRIVDGIVRGIGAMLLLAMMHDVPLAAEIPQQDVPGSSDSPLVPRYADARIVSYDQAPDEEAILPEGRFTDFNFVKKRTAEGRVTRIAYAFPKVLSTVEVMNHYRDVLKGGGFKIVFECSGAEGCGGFSFGELLTQSMVEAHAGEEGNHIIDFLHPVGNDIRYVLATLDRPQGSVTLALAVARRVGSQPGMFVETVEQKPVDDDEPAVNATRIAAALHVQGRIALYSLHFVPDQATLRPDSRAILKQIAAVLNADPSMKLIVVGHTDGSGLLDRGLQLSAARAQTVMKALVKNWKVSASQVTSIGVGPVSPIASNSDGPGRALNARIELVLQ